MKIVFGKDTGSVEDASQCIVLDVPDDLDADETEEWAAENVENGAPVISDSEGGQVTLSASTEEDAIIDLGDRRPLWLTVRLGEGRPTASLALIRTDEGLVVDLYAYGQEDGEALGGTWVLDQDLIDVTEAAGA
jgi:hypothetical protein